MRDLDFGASKTVTLLCCCRIERTHMQVVQEMLIDQDIAQRATIAILAEVSKVTRRKNDLRAERVQPAKS